LTTALDVLYTWFSRIGAPFWFDVALLASVCANLLILFWKPAKQLPTRIDVMGNLIVSGGYLALIGLVAMMEAFFWFDVLLLASICAYLLLVWRQVKRGSLLPRIDLLGSLVVLGGFLALVGLLFPPWTDVSSNPFAIDAAVWVYFIGMFRITWFGLPAWAYSLVGIGWASLVVFVTIGIFVTGYRLADAPYGSLVYGPAVGIGGSVILIAGSSLMLFERRSERPKSDTSGMLV
jgi:hypothetical protein